MGQQADALLAPDFAARTQNPATPKRPQRACSEIPAASCESSMRRNKKAIAEFAFQTTGAL